MKDADGTTCNCGVIHGGTVPNSVAEECNFFADIRFSTFEELENVKKRVEEISQTTYVAGCSCELKEISYRPAMSRTEKNVEFLNEMNKIFENNGLAVLEARSCLSGSDAAYITECRIPCVDNLGTEGKNIHSINEYIKLASLAESAKKIASVIYCI